MHGMDDRDNVDEVDGRTIVAAVALLVVVHLAVVDAASASHESAGATARRMVPAPQAGKAVPRDVMERIYEQVKTPSSTTARASQATPRSCEWAILG